MVKNLPSQYLFFLLCCLRSDCSHPICKSADISKLPTWYDNGPPINYIPLPVVDPSHPWGNTNCTKCQKPVCLGHYLEEADAINSDIIPMSKPPSQLIREAFEDNMSQYPPSDDRNS